jgi:hypothetical protein
MSINIYKKDEYDQLTYLCEGEWKLPAQIDELENWLSNNSPKLPKGSYVADVGFRVRKGATGGGAVVSLKLMEMMIAIGMELYLSEYD